MKEINNRIIQIKRKKQLLRSKNAKKIYEINKEIKNENVLKAKRNPRKREEREKSSKVEK